jgi:hypothetical protein
MSLASVWGELVVALHAGSETASSGYVAQDYRSRYLRTPRPQRSASRRGLNGSASAGLTFKRQMRNPRPGKLLVVKVHLELPAVVE